MRWWIVLLLLPTAAAEVDLDAISTDEGLLLSRDHADARHDPDQALADGDGTAEQITWSLYWDRAAYLEGNATAAARIGSDTAIKDVSVTMRISSGNRTLATGAARETGLSVGFETLRWSVPVAPGAVDGVWWNITATGTFSALFLDTAGNATHLVVPTRPPPPPPLVQEQQNITAPGLHVVRDLDEAYLHQRLHWLHAPGEVNVTWNGTLASGSLRAWLVDPQGETAWQTAWPDGAAGLQNVSALPGNWTLHIEAVNATGSYDIRLDQIVAKERPDEPVKRRSPLPLAAVLAALWIAAKR